MTKETNPVDPNVTFTLSEKASIVHSSVTDTASKAMWVHKDLVQVRGPYEDEAHIPPMTATEHFGDVDSFVQYVVRYGGDGSHVHARWNSKGFIATLDYPAPGEIGGRRAWTANYEFCHTPQWLRWQSICGGAAIAQKTAVEWLENYADDIADPSPVELANILRHLRTTVNSKADVQIKEDGTQAVSFSKDTTVRGGGVDGEAVVPNVFSISIPVLKGHINADGKPVVYSIQVRLRLAVDDKDHLGVRFAMPDAERVLEDVYTDRVTLCKSLLDLAGQATGSQYFLLRANG